MFDLVHRLTSVLPVPVLVEIQRRRVALYPPASAGWQGAAPFTTIEETFSWS